MFRIDHAYLSDMLELRGDRYHHTLDDALWALGRVSSFDDGGILDDCGDCVIYRTRVAALRGDDPIAVITWEAPDPNDEYLDRYGDTPDHGDR